MSNEFDDAVASTLQGEKARSARFGFMSALDTDPDAHAEALRVARRTGVPVATALNQPELVKRQDVMGRIDFDTLAKVAPATADLLSDPETAKLAHDDVDGMGKLESAFYTLGKYEVRGARALAASIPAFNSGMFGVARAGTELASKYLTAPLAGRILPEDPLARAAGFLGEQQKRSAFFAEKWMPKADTPTEAAVYSGVRSLGQNLLTAPFAVLTGNPNAALIPMVGQVGGESYGKARDQGLGVEASINFGARDALIEYATEKLPMSWLLKDLKAGASFGKTLLHNAVSEVPGEQLATFFQDANEWVTLNPDKPASEFIKARPAAMYQTLIATLIGSGGMVGTLKGVEKGMELTRGRTFAAEQAAPFAETLSAINQLAAASKLRERDSDTAQQFFQSLMDEGQDAVWITPEALAQSGLAEQLAQALPSVQEQLEAAVESGHDIRLPIAEMMARLPGPELEQAILPHVSEEPGGFTRTTAEEYLQSGAAQELEAEIGRIVRQQEENDGFRQSVNAIREDIRGQLEQTGRFTSPVNDAYAAMVANTYAVLAERTGMTPEALHQRFKLRIGAEAVTGGNTLEQPVTGQFNWEFGQRKGLFQQPDIAVTSIKGDELGGDERTIRSRAMRELAAAGKTGLRNRDTGWTLTVSNPDRKKIAKWYGNSVESVKAVAAIGQLVDRAVLAESHADEQHNNPDVQGIHRLFAPIEIDGVLYRAKMTVRDYVGANSATRLHSLEAIEIERAPLGTSLSYSGAEALQTAQPTTERTVSIAHLLSSSSRNNGSRWDTASNEYNQSVEDSFAQTARAYGGEAAWEQARAEGKTKLNYRQWVQVRTPEFKDWFGDWQSDPKNASKVIDPETGEPMVVFHGGTVGNVFDAAHNGTGGGRESAFFFTPDIRQARDYAGGKAVKAVFLQIKNPLPTDTQLEPDEAAQAREDGHDGYWVIDDGLVDESEIAAFSPTQIKSATGNTGEFSKDNPDILHQAARGTFNPASLTITLNQSANLSTFLHETGHFFLEVYADLAAQNDIPPAIQQDFQRLLDWFGVKNLDEWNALPFEEKRAHHEQFARGFEAWLFEGKAPNPELSGIFQRFRSWLISVYHDLKNLNVTLSDEVRGVFDRMVATDEQIALAEQGRSMMPLFASQETSGMTPEEFADYQANGQAPTEEAIAWLQAKGLRDMQWLRNAHGKYLKALQQEAKEKRTEVERDAHREIMSQPIYRAWRFLTGKMGAEDRIDAPERPKSSPDHLDETMDSLFVAIAKLGGLNKEEVISAWGTDLADKPQSGVFGKPLWRIEGGLSIDGMAEALAQYGYLTPDQHGKVDIRELEEKFSAEVRGDTQYSTAYNPGQFAPVRPGDQLANPEALGAGRFDLGALTEMYGASVNQARPVRQAETLDKARQLAMDFVGAPLSNRQTRMVATVSKTTLGKMLSGKAVMKSASGADYALAVANADHLFAEAVLDETTPDSRNEPTIAGIHRFFAPMVTPDGRVLAVKLTVKETTGKNEPNPLYTLEAIDVEKPALRAPEASGIERGIGGEAVATTTTGGLSEKVLAMIDHVKQSLDSEEFITQRLKSLRMTATTGLHPDLVADLFGFSSGDELVRTLLETPPPKAAINALTDQRLLERYGELSSPEALQRAADEAVHNEARARMVATEARALARATGKQPVLLSAARDYAATVVARLKIRHLKPGQYASAAARAGKNAAKASQSGDVATAAAEKRTQLLNTTTTRAVYAAQTEIEQGLRYLKKFDGDIKALDADYAEQIASLLERFDLRKGQSNKAVDKRTALAEWLEAQRDAGLAPDIPEALENEAFRTSYKNLSVEEFRGLVDTVRQIEHLGRLKHKLLTAKGQRDYAAARDEIAASIHAHSQGRAADTRTPTTNRGRAVQGLKRFWAAHIKAATWARIMDGGKDGGPVWEYFIRSANERGDQETTMRAEATARLSAIMAPVFKQGKMGGKGQFFPSIGRSLNRESVFAIALNLGNEGNTQRLLGGEGWTIQQVTPVLQSLTAQEWQAVQAVWDHFETYRPQIAAKERRIYGKAPDWVEARPFAVTAADGTTVQMRGGYYPIKYDPAASQRSEEHDDAESARRQLQGAYTTATTRRSFTKGRVKEVQGRPLLYTLAGLYSGVNEVIHDLAWHEWLIDANRLLRSHTIDTAIREHYGPEVKQQFKSWVQDVAEGDSRVADAGEAALGRIRQGVSAAGMGFNVMSAAVQVLGMTQSISRIGVTWAGRGIAQYLAHPIERTRQVNTLSRFMENRARTRFRELNELRNQVQDRSAAREFIGRYAYFMMMRCQQMVDVPTWLGGYEKAISEGHAEDRAIALADQAVLDAQGGGQVKDLSAIERGGPAMRLFTVFYSFMNTALNVGVEKTMSADTPAKRAKLAADYLLLYTVPAVLGMALKNALTPDNDDDWDWEKLAQQLAAEQLAYLMGLMVVVRELGEAGKILVGADGVRDYAGPAGTRLLADSLKFFGQARQGEFDDAFRKAAINLLGDFTGLPSAQANRSISGAQALAEGRTDNPAAIAFGFQQKR